MEAVTYQNPALDIINGMAADLNWLRDSFTVAGETLIQKLLNLPSIPQVYNLAYTRVAIEAQDFTRLHPRIAMAATLTALAAPFIPGLIDFFQHNSVLHGHVPHFVNNTVHLQAGAPPTPETITCPGSHILGPGENMQGILNSAFNLQIEPSSPQAQELIRVSNSLNGPNFQVTDILQVKPGALLVLEKGFCHDVGRYGLSGSIAAVATPEALPAPVVAHVYSEVTPTPSITPTALSTPGTFTPQTIPYFCWGSSLGLGLLFGGLAIFCAIPHKEAKE